MIDMSILLKLVKKDLGCLGQAASKEVQFRYDHHNVYKDSFLVQKTD